MLKLIMTNGGPMMIKKLIFLVFALILVFVAYDGTAFAATPNSTNITQNTTNITYTQDIISTDPANSSNLNQDQVSNNNQTNSTFKNINGYYIDPADTPVNTVDPATLKAQGVTTIFVLTDRQDPSGTLEPFIKKFAGSGIGVYAWLESFKDFNGNWFNPQDNITLEDQIINDITTIATNYDINGVMLDYLRYPGTAYEYPNATSTVNSFAAAIRDKINIINNEKIAGKPTILISAALMPEDAVNDYYYGQNYTSLSEYLDFLSPMIYVGNYNETTSWIGTTTEYIQAESSKPVVAILQTYDSDSDPTALTLNQLDSDIQTALLNGSHGYELFRYGMLPSNMKAYDVSPVVNTVSPDTITNVTTMPITITFSETIKAGSLWIVLENSKGKLEAITTSISGNVLTIKHSPLPYDTYTVILHTGSITNLFGNSLQLWSDKFTVGKIVPLVTSTSPSNGAKGIALTTPIIIKFGENILGGSEYSQIYVKNLNTGKIVAITKKISGNTLTIKQNFSRLYKDTYEVYIPAKSIKDQKGNYLTENYIIKFTTV